MAKQLAFEYSRGEPRAVDFEVGLFPPVAQVMDGLGHQFLAGPGFTADEHRDGQFRHFGDLVPDPLDGR